MFMYQIVGPHFIIETLSDLKAQEELNTVIAGDFNTVLSPIGQPDKN